MLRRPSALVLPLWLALACSTSSSPHEQTIPRDPSTWRTHAEFQRTLKALPNAEQRLLNGWMMRHALMKGSAPTTIGEALEEQRAFIEERKREEAAQEGAAAEPAAS